MSLHDILIGVGITLVVILGLGVALLCLLVTIGDSEGRRK